jgi:hypothetical protein
MMLDEYSRDHFLRPEIGKPLVAIGYVYILIFIMVSGVHWYATQGWSHFLDISYNLSDANNWLALLIMLPGIGLVRLGEKLRKIDASDRLVAKLQEMSLSPDSSGLGRSLEPLHTSSVGHGQAHTTARKGSTIRC